MSDTQTQHVQDDLLQRYHDGEVEERQASEVRTHVEACEHCTTRMASLSKLHTMLSAAADEFGDAVHSDALFARIEQGLRAAPAPGLGERLRLWWDDLLEPLQPRGMWVPAVAAVGVAVALFLVARPGGSPESRSPGGEVAVRMPVGPNAPVGSTASTPSGGPTPVAVEPQLAAMLPSEVVALESAITATYFPVEAGEGTSTQVVWIEE